MQTNSLGVRMERGGLFLPGTLRRDGTAGSVERRTLGLNSVNAYAIPPASSFEFLRPTVLGAIDGLITSFVVVISAIAGGVNVSGALTIGFASLVADGFSMGASEFLSNRQETNNRWTSLRYGIACFLAFIVCGSVPLVTSFIVPDSWDDTSRTILLSVTYTMLLLVIGVSRGLLDGPVCESTLEVLGLGILAGGIAYGVASLSTD